MTKVQYITGEVAKRFRCFGRGDACQDNPISHALRDKPPMFAAGVDVEEVVRFVLDVQKRDRRK